MEEFGPDRSMHVAIATAPGWIPLSAWRPRTWLVVIPLALLVSYAFMPSLANDFVEWDDRQNFIENPFFHGLGTAQIKWAWTTFWVGVYQPLAWLLFEAQYTCFELNPRGYHITSLVLHVTNAVVLYGLTLAVLARCRGVSRVESGWPLSLSAGLACALFAVHPLRVEPVAWVSCQPYLPCILFSMLATLTYLRAFPLDSTLRLGWMSVSFLMFLTAILFKAVAVSLPAVLLILDVYPLRRFGGASGPWYGASARRALLEKIPFVTVSLIFMGLAIAAKPQSRLPVHHDRVSDGIARACYGIWFYVIKTVLPFDLTAFYPAPSELNWLAPPFSVSILATLAMSAGLFLLRRRWPGLLAAWLSYLVILAPNSGIVWIGTQIAADRYSYMSMLASVMLAATGFCWIWRMSARWHPDAPIGFAALGFGSLVVLAGMTRNQCRTWRDTEVLWTHALTHGADASFEARNNLGTFVSRQQRYAEAESHFAAAIRLHPEYSQAHYNLGLVYSEIGRYEEAITQFDEAIALQRGDSKAYNAAAMIMATCPEAKFRDGKRAIDFATRSCELTNWKNPVILDTLAAAQAEAGDFDAAVASQERAIALVKDQRQADDYRSRLALYQGKSPYRQRCRRGLE